jgi:hypothetical protein
MVALQGLNQRQTMNRNSLYLAVGALAVATVVIGYALYQERQTTGVEIKIGDHAISVDGT